MMNYILKVYHKSKYLGFEKIQYKEFDNLSDLMSYVLKNKLEDNYQIYIKKGSVYYGL